MKCNVRIFLLGLGIAMTIASARPTSAAMMTFNASTVANNAASRTAWLAAAGITMPENLVDFEVGFTALQNISGVGGLFPEGLVITDTGTAGTPSAIIRTGDGTIGNSNPVGVYSVTHDEQAYLELDFSLSPVDYVAFQDIDHSGTDGIVTFVGGATAAFSLDVTATANDSAEFFGIFRNDMPKITLVQLDASGDGRWGIDTIEYGQVPEPCALTLAAVSVIFASAVGRCRRRS